MYIAIIVTLAGLAWFFLAQRRPDRPVVVSVPAATPGGEAAARQGGEGSKAESEASPLPVRTNDSPACWTGSASAGSPRPGLVPGP